jgi:hypothetical protein
MIELTVNVDDRALLARLDQLPKTLQVRLRAVIEAQTSRLLAAVLNLEPVRTGALREHTVQAISEGEDYVRGRVHVLAGGGDAFTYARAGALEYGAHREAKVSAHSALLSQVYGQLIDARVVMVEAYTRQANIQALRFLRGPFEAIRTAALAEMQRAIDEEISRAHSI